MGKFPRSRFTPVQPLMGAFALTLLGVAAIPCAGGKTTRCRWLAPPIALALLVGASLVVEPVALQSGAPISAADSFNPEASDLVFVASDRMSTRWDIYVVNADGSGPVRVTDDAVEGIEPIWSPDGQNIAFVQPPKLPLNLGRVWLAAMDTASLVDVLKGRPFPAEVLALPSRPEWSPDGGHLLFYDRDCGHFGSGGLFIFRFESEEPIIVAQPGRSCIGAAAWSPDGASIAFSQGRESPKEPGVGIYVLDPMGDGTPELLVPDIPGVVGLTWAPDGSALAFVPQWDPSDGSPPRGWYLVARDGGQPALVDLTGLNARISPWNISWSPLGDKIGFFARAEGDALSSLWIAEPDGANARRLAQGVPADFRAGPAWSPDGLYLAVPLVRDDNADVCVIPVEEGELKCLTESPWDDTLPAWSPGERRLAFATRRHSREGVYRASPDGTALHQLMDGLVLRRLFGHGVTPGPQGRFSIRFSPDRGRIAYHAASGNTLDVFLATPDGSSTTNLTRTPQLNETNPLWSPDGTKLAFISGQRLEIINADGSERRALVEGFADSDNAMWRPDPSGLLFTRGADVFTINWDGTGRRQLADLGSVAGKEGSVAWTPDGSLIAVATGSSLLVVSTADGHRRDLRLGIPVGGPFRTGALAWSPDGQWIAFTGGEPSPHRGEDLYLVRPDGTGLWKIAERTHLYPYLTWSTDSTRIAFISSGGGCLAGCPPGFLYSVDVDGDGPVRISDLWVDAILAWLPR